MSYDNNVYDSPEKHGLEIVDTISGGGGYDFDDVVVFKHKESGCYYWAADSGCSCPTPFESYERVEDLEKLPETLADFEKAVHEIYGEKSEEKMTFIQSIRKLVGPHPKESAL